MRYRVLVDRRVASDLEAAPRHVRHAFFRALEELADDPRRPRPRCDVRRLRGLPGEVYRLRLGTWRVLYAIEETERVVKVTTASPRKSAYR